MRNNIFAALLLIAMALAFTVGFTKRNNSLQVTSPRINIKDLPQHGLSIVGPSDGAYNEMVGALTQGHPNNIVEALRPYSIFIKNTGSKAVVACQLRWDFVYADGSVKTEKNGFVGMGRLMNQGVSGAVDYIIRPNSTWFFSPTGIDIYQEINQFGSANNAQEDTAKVATEGMRNNYLQKITAKLAHFSSITVSLDGVFFEDGTFVGPDTTNFFAKVTAAHDARRDLFNELEQDIKNGRAKAEVLKKIEALANAPTGRISSTTSAAEFYDFYKRVDAKELLRIREKSGDDKMLRYALIPLRKSWIELKKN